MVGFAIALPTLRSLKANPPPKQRQQPRQGMVGKNQAGNEVAALLYPHLL